MPYTTEQLADLWERLVTLSRAVGILMNITQNLISGTSGEIALVDSQKADLDAKIRAIGKGLADGVAAGRIDFEV